MNDLLAELKLLIDKDKVWTEQEEEQLLLFLNQAYRKCMNRRFPFGYESTDVLPVRYEGVQLTLAVALYNRQGAEGQTSHSENEISRSFESEEEILKAILPLGKGV